MESKTPKSDSLIDEILAGLVPHTRVCKWKGEHQHCEGEFEIVDEDISFLRMLRVLPPNFCPTCRRMRRLVHMNMIRFFKRPCNIPNHTENMISILPSECPFPVYEYTHFISDEFDAFSFGEIYKEGNSPMQTLFDLRKKFPMPSFLNRDSGSVNSDYSNGGRDNKNCYYAFGCYTSENVWYSHMMNHCNDVMDSRAIQSCEHCYMSLYSQNIYNSSFVYFSKDSIDSMFLFDCKNCISCFGCVNLRNKSYCIFNQQYTKEDYAEFINSLYPISNSKLNTLKEKFWELVRSLPVNASRNTNVSNVKGVLAYSSKDLFDVVDAENSEHVRHSDGVLSHKDSMDFLFSGGKSSRLYGTTNIGSQSSEVRFSVSSKFCTNSEFIFNSKNLNNCFMCFGLQNKSYCVLNVQYSPEEYFKIVDDIKSEMIKRGEYNDGLGLEFSAQAYNFSIAQISYPLSDTEINKLGGYVAKESETNVGDTQVLSVEELPQNIEDVTDDILSKAIKCDITGRPFRITKTELDFLKRMKLPLPTSHPSVRMENHFKFVPIGKKYSVSCIKCNQNTDSLFSKEQNFILYCDNCYNQDVV